MNLPGIVSAHHTWATRTQHLSAEARMLADSLLVDLLLARRELDSELLAAMERVVTMVEGRVP